MKKPLTLSPAILAAIGAIILIIGFIAGTRSEFLYAAFGPLVGIRTTADTLDDSKLQSTYRTLKAYYNGTLNEQELIEGAQEGLVAAAGDPYTTYLSPEEAEEFNKDLSGDIGGGIGAEIGMRNEMPTIVRTLKNNPAKAAGLHANDIILKVNDESTEGWDVEQTVANIKGEPGSTVKLVVKRGNDLKEFSVERAIINNPSVASEMKNNIGVLTVSRFDEETVGLVRKEVTSLKQRGMTRIVLDLRGNGGGYLDAAPGVVGMWVKNKPVVSVQAKNGARDQLRTEGDAILKGTPTAVLVNAGTASASEIVAIALKQYKVATIIGEKTFGKGTVQELVPLADGAILKVTIKRWYAPNGANLTDTKGIQPNVKVELDQKALDAGKDPQLNAAIKRLRQ